MSCHRLCNSNLWDLNLYFERGHREIKRLRESSKGEGDDEIVTKWNHNKRYQITYEDGGTNKETEKWYVDGAKNKEGAAVGLFNPVRSIKVGKRAHDSLSSLQLEVLAIKEAADWCLTNGIKEKEIVIITDCNIALRQLDSFEINNGTLLSCISSLNKLGTLNKIYVKWEPGHKWSFGMTVADSIAKSHCSKPTIELKAPPSKDRTADNIKLKCVEEALVSWKSHLGTTKLKHSLKYISPYDKTFANGITSMNRMHTRLSFAILTGHCLVGKYLKLFGKSNSDRCRMCNKPIIESTDHLISSCSALKNWRRKRWKTDDLNLTRPQQMNLDDLIAFSKETGIARLILTGLHSS
jgi:ribonuclease HI